MPNHLFDAIRAAVGDIDSVFIDDGKSRQLTYGDMLEQSGRLAGVLVDRGVSPGDRVAVQVEKSAEALMLYLACLRSGAVYLPLNTGYTPAEIDYFIGDAEPRIFVCDAAAEAAMRPIAEQHGASIETMSADGRGTLTSLAAEWSGEFEDVDRAADDLAAILYTSGTTGRSKGAMLTHDNLLSNAISLKNHWRFTHEDRLIHALPIFHTHGLFVGTNVTLISGASMFLLPKFDTGQVLSLMLRASVMMGVPTFYVRLLQDSRLDKETTAGMRLFISGSAPLLSETFEAFELRTGHAILERYGMTETNMNTSNPYSGKRVAGTVGMPLPGVEVRISEPEKGTPVAQGEIGMIEVRGPNVFRGYWRMPEKTASEFRTDGFFITGDLGKIDTDGYIHIIGRGKDLVISGGYNIYPKEVEIEIDSIPGVIESAVIGVQHPDFGEGVTAVVVKQADAPLGEEEIFAVLAGRLARYKQPKRIIFVEDLPRNTMGKVQKNVLREAYQSIYQN